MNLEIRKKAKNDFENFFFQVDEQSNIWANVWKM